MMHRYKLSLDEWTTYLRAHLPRGNAWLDPDGRLARLCRGCAVEAKRVHDLMVDLYTSLDRSTMTDPVLADWEATCALPDPDLPAPATVDARRASVLERVNRTHWKQTQGHYIALAALNGVTVTIDRPDGFVSVFRVKCVDGSWIVARCGTASRCSDRTGSTTVTGAKVQRSFLRRKRVHARILWR